jgi:hypothetical protein
MGPAGAGHVRQPEEDVLGVGGELLGLSSGPGAGVGSNPPVGGADGPEGGGDSVQEGRGRAAGVGGRRRGGVDTRANERGIAAALPVRTDLDRRLQCPELLRGYRGPS